MSVRNFNKALTLLLNASAAAGRVSALLQQVQLDGRDGPSDAEMASLELADDAQRAELVDAIQATKAGG